MKPATMETSTITSQRTRKNQRHTVKTAVVSNDYHPEESAKQRTHTVVIPFLILVYIFNGSHDPKKVHWLNIILSVIFFIAGLVFNPDLLMVGTLFFTIALTNIACVWVVQNLGRSVWTPTVETILSQLHDSVRCNIEQ